MIKLLLALAAMSGDAHCVLVICDAPRVPEVSAIDFQQLVNIEQVWKYSEISEDPETQRHDATTEATPNRAMRLKPRQEQGSFG